MRIPWKWLALVVPPSLLIACSDQPTAPKADATAAAHMLASSHAGAITVFDAPGAGGGAGQGTEAPGINPAGAITGFYFDAGNVTHGFLREPDGKITTFDAPGAGSATVSGFVMTPAGLGGQGTYAISINPAGAITGFYVDGSNVSHGFLRAPDGKFTTFDAPGASAGFGQGLVWGTAASCINPAGAITGFDWDASGTYHGFVRGPDGTIAEFEVPGATTTFAWSINPEGAVTADYLDAYGVAHGYVRAPDGAITTFDVPGAGTGAGQGTIPEGIYPAGIAGNYVDASGANHGFVRAMSGKLTTFDAPGAGAGPGQGTIPLTPNPAGAITGMVIDQAGVIHGFVRAQ